MRHETHKLYRPPATFYEAVTRYKSLALLVLYLFTLPLTGHAALVTIGAADSKSDGYTGLYPLYAYSSGETIYTPAELGSAGTITSFALNKASGTGRTDVDSVYIYMKETSATILGATPALAGYTLVYKGNLPNNAASGWMTVTLSSPFTYTGSGNLGVLIVRHNGTAMSAADYPSYYSSTAGGYVLNYYSGNTDYWTGWAGSTASAVASDFTAGFRPQIQLNIDAFSACSGKPVAGTPVTLIPATACAGSAVRFSLSGSSAASGLSYAWDTSASGTGGWGLAATSSAAAGAWSFTPDRALYYRCRVSCAAASDTSAVLLYTPAIKPPYLETFESGTMGKNMPCASSTNTFGNSNNWNLLVVPFNPSYPAMNNHTSGGSKYLIAGYILGNYSSGKDEYWFTPGLALTAGKNYEVSFWFNGSGYSGGNGLLGLAAGTAQTAAGMTISMGPDTFVNTTTYTQFTRNFTSPTTGIYYVGIKVNHLVYNTPGFAIDDISVKEQTTCTARPVAGVPAASPNLLCSSTSTSVLSLTGTSSVSGLSYQWQSSATGLPGSWSNAPGASASPIYTTPTPAATMYYRCYVSCASATAPNTDTSAAIQVLTVPITPPYTETFESGFMGKNMACAANTNTFGNSNYWNLLIAPLSGYPAIINHTAGGSKFLMAGYNLGSYSSGKDEYWFSPGLALTAGKNYEASFWFNGSGSTSGSVTLGLAAGTAQTAAGMTIAMGTDTTISSTTTYAQLVRNFTAPATGTYYIGIKVNHLVYNYPGVAIDDISVKEQPTCTVRPVAGTVSASPNLLCSSTSTSVLSLLGTSSASGLSFQWQSSPSGLPGSWVNAAGASTSTLYTTPTPAVGQYYRCYVSCGSATDTSAAIQLKLAPLTLPYLETFESGSNGKNMACAFNTNTFGNSNYWNLLTAPMPSYPAIDNHTTGGSKFLLAGYNLGTYSSRNDEYWFTPGLSLNSGKTYEVSFWFNGSGSTSGNTLLGITAGTAQTAAAMTISMGPDTMVTTTTYTQFTRNFISPGTGTYYIGIKVNHLVYSYPGVAIDDISVKEQPTCASSPVAGTVSALPNLLCSATSTSVLSLIGTSSVSGLNYQWQSSVTGLPGSWSNAAGVSTAPSYTTLTPAVALYYRCYVLCPSATFPNTDTSAGILLNLAPLGLPYTETFESGSLGKNMPCASNTNTFGNSNYWNLLTGPMSGYPAILNHTAGGSKFLLAGYNLGTYSSKNDEYWFTPGLALNAGKNYEVSFWFNGSGSTSGSTVLGIAAGTAQTAAGMTISMGPDTTVTTTTYAQLTRNFTAPATGTYYVGIKVNHLVYSYPGVAIDDISVKEQPGCTGRPVAGTVSATPNLLCAATSTSVLSLLGTTSITGLTYQWQSSATGVTGSWVNASGAATGTTYTTPTPATAMYYRCYVTCPGATAPNTDTTAGILLNLAPITPPYTETFESGNLGKNMPCAANTNTFSNSNYWNLLTAPMSGYPAILNHTAGGSKYLLGGYNLGAYSSKNDEYWFTPGLALTAGKNYEVSFWFNGSGSTSGSTVLGLAAGTAQTAAGMTITMGPDTAVSTTTYAQFLRNFTSPTTGTYYVGIKVNHLVYSYPGVAIDDISMREQPACTARPVAGTVSATPNLLCASTSTSVLSLLGTTSASGLIYQWQRSATGLPGSWSNATGTSNTSVYTTPTPAATAYYRCYVTCPGATAPNTDTSAAILLSLAPITPPYTETFESGSMGKNMPCAANTNTFSNSNYWNLLIAPMSGYPAIVNHTAGGSKYLIAGYQLGIYSSGKEEYWFTPGLALTTGKNYEVSFWFNGSGSATGSSMLGLAAGTAQTAAGMTIAMGPDTIVTTTTYAQLTRNFTAPSTGTYYVGIKINHLVYSYPGVVIDDISVKEQPGCTARPVAGTVSALPNLLCSSTSTAVLSLTGSSSISGLSYQWQSSPSGLPGSWTNASGTSTLATYTTATPAATLYYRCYVGCSSATAPNTDTTAAILVNTVPVTPPYMETFESGIMGKNMPCASNTNTFGSMTYWNLMIFPHASYASVVNHTAGGSKYLLAGYNLGAYSSGKDEYWFSPGITLKGGETYEGSFWYVGSGTAGGYTRLGMYCGFAQTAAAMTIPIAADKVVVTANTYQQIASRFTAPVNGVYYLGIKVNNLNSYCNPGLAIDDIQLTQLPLCSGKPVAGAISVAPAMLCSAGPAKLAMDLAGTSKVAGLSYRWEWTTINPATGFIATGTAAEATAPDYTTATLSATTWFRCIVKCTVTGDSAISGVQKVDFGAITPPYIETFESGIAGLNMPCASYSGRWATGSWFLYGAPDATYAAMDNHTPGGNKYLVGGYNLGYSSGVPGASYWFTPAIKLTAGKLYQFSFWYNGTGGYPGTTAVLGAYYGTAQTAAAMTTGIGTDKNVNTSAYRQFSERFTATGTNEYYIGIKVQNPTTYAPPGIVIDDIGLQEVPACSAPVVAGTITSDPVRICAAGSTATLDLLGSTVATGLSYSWLSAPDSAGPYTAAGGGLPFNTAPLFANTWFRAIVTCTASGATDTSAPFRMATGSVDLPYTETFESTPVGGVPVCSDATFWGTNTYEGWRILGGTPYPNHTPGGRKYLIGGYYLGSPASLPTDNYWFTPSFDLRAGYKYNLSFWYIGSDGTKVNRMGVYYGAAQTAGAMTNVIAPFRAVSNSSYVRFDTVFTPAVSGTYYLGFRKSGSDPVTTYSYNGVAFDDINLRYHRCDGMPVAGAIKGSNPSGVSLCKGTFVTLRNVGATYSQVPGIHYQWQRRAIGATGWSSIAGATDSVYSADSLIDWEYRMLVVCKPTLDTAVTAVYQLPATPAHPPVSIIPAGSSIAYCLGDTVFLKATAYSGATYDWMKDNKVIPGWKFNDLGATDPGRYMVKVSSPLSPCPAYSESVDLVASRADFTVDITKPADSFFCEGDAISLAASASVGGVTYKWRKNNIDIPGASAGTYLVNTSGTYRVAAYKAGSSCPALSRSIKFTVKPKPVAAIVAPGGSLTACENEGVQLDASTGAFYQWSRAGSVVFGWVDSSVLVKTSGIYSVKITSADGCTNVSAGVRVNILPSPVPIVTKSGLVLNATGGFVSYKWKRNGVEVPGATSATLNLTHMGSYVVVVTDVNNCSGESAPIVVMDAGLGVDNTPGNEGIKIYPNPTKSKVFIEAPRTVRVKVQDVTGRLVLDQQETKEIDLSPYADGMYLFTITDEAGTILQRTKINKATK